MNVSIAKAVYGEAEWVPDVTTNRTRSGHTETITVSPLRTLRLTAVRGTPDGIGCGLVFLPWDGNMLTVKRVVTERWYNSPWADFWWVSRPALGYGDCYPLRYMRLHRDFLGCGTILGGLPEHQRIVLTFARAGVHVPRGDYPRVDEIGNSRTYVVSHVGGANHMLWNGGTISLTSPRRELGLYCEGCDVEFTFSDEPAEKLENPVHEDAKSYPEMSAALGLAESRIELVRGTMKLIEEMSKEGAESRGTDARHAVDVLRRIHSLVRDA